MKLTVRCLGPLEIALDDKPLHGFKTRKVQALLVYLMLHAGQFFPREHLQALLWSDSTAKKAAASFRQALANLRSLLPDGTLLVELGAYAFNCDSDYFLDVDALERQPDLYRGPFLQGFDLSGAHEWEEWLYTTRERLQISVLEHLEARGKKAASQGNIAAAIEIFQQMIRIDPWREDIHRGLMRLFDLAGDRPAALAQYEKCHSILTGEVGVEPAVETTALYQRILSGEESTSVSGENPLSIAKPPSPQLPFVGRENELDQLLASWEQSRRGRSNFAMIEGEAGLGKTRLADEVLRVVADQGALVLRTRCYEFGAGVPYQPLVEIVAAVLLGEENAINPPPLTTLEPVWLAELAFLLPQIHQLHPNLSPLHPAMAAGDSQDNQAQQRLFEAVHQALQAALLGRRHGQLWQPLVLFVDDLHWIDTASLDLLHYLIRRLANRAVWFLGSYRREELEFEHPLLQMRRALSRDRKVTLVRLLPLTPDSIAAGVQSMGSMNQDAAYRLSEHLERESEGNPFILGELLYDLAERDTLRWSPEGNGWLLNPSWDSSQEGIEVPFAVRELILDRLARLARPSQELMRLAAVIGRAFDLSLLREAARLMEKEGASAPLLLEVHVESWLNRRLFRVERQSQTGTVPSAEAVHLLDFGHDMIRAVLYQSTDPLRKATMHRLVAAALETLHAGRLQNVYEQLAYHYEQAGARDKALVYLPLAGAKSAAVYAYSEALDYYRRALALLPAGDSRRWEFLLLQIGVLRLLGEFGQAIRLTDVFFMTAQNGEETGVGTAPPLWQGRAAVERGEIDLTLRNYASAWSWTETARRLAEDARVTASDRRTILALAVQTQARIAREEGRLDDAQALFEEALAIYGEEAPLQETVECLNGLGHILANRGYYKTALVRFEEVLALYRSLEDRRSQATCLRTIGRVCWRMGDNDRAQRSFNESLELCQAIADRRGEAESISELGLIHISQGDSESARLCWEESVVIFRSLGLERRTAPALHNLGIVYITKGEYGTAQRHLEESLALNRADGALPVQALDLGWLGLLAYQRGSYAQAESHLEAALALDAQMGGSEEAIWHLTWMGMVQCELGRLDQGERYLLSALEQGVERGIDRRLHEVYHWLALIAMRRGDGPAALAAAQAALSGADAGASEHALLGMVYASGLLDTAENPLPCFRKAMEMGDFNPFKRGIVLGQVGAFFLQTGNQAEGVALLQQAEDILGAIGAEGELEKIFRARQGNLYGS